MSKKAAWTFVALVFVVNAVRFVHLDADFPPGITSSRTLYTDEGLYSANAINLSAGRPWHTPGELNAIINLPVAPVLQAIVFRTFGRTLITARSLVAVATLVLIAAAVALTANYAPLPGAMLVALILSLDFLLFSYSRLAIFDVIMTMFVTLAFAIASSVRGKPVAVAAALAGALIAVATLTKTTAICALPAVAYLCSVAAVDTTRRRQLAAIAVAASTLVLAAYNAFAWYAYPVDYVYFHRIAETRLAAGPLDLVRNFAVAIFNTIRFDPSLSLATFGLTIALYRTSAAFRANVLVRTSAIWVLGFLAMLSITSYQPSRYFVVVLVPMVILFAMAIWHVHDLFPGRRRTAAILSTAIVGSVLILNAGRIGYHLTHPKYSFVHMARDVGDIVNGSSSSRRPGVLLGNMAMSVSLENGVRAVSVEYGTRDLAMRIAAACPTHFITLQTPGEDEHRALSPYYVIEPVREWTVFENYYEHRPVRLFRLHPRPGRRWACQR